MIPSGKQKSLNASLSNCFPLLETDSRDLEATNDALPDEVSDILLNDYGQGFHFDPFHEVVDSYDEELELPYHHRAFVEVSYFDGCLMMLLKC